MPANGIYTLCFPESLAIHHYPWLASKSNSRTESGDQSTACPPASLSEREPCSTTPCVSTEAEDSHGEVPYLRYSAVSTHAEFGPRSPITSSLNRSVPSPRDLDELSANLDQHVQGLIAVLTEAVRVRVTAPCGSTDTPHTTIPPIAVLFSVRQCVVLLATLVAFPSYVMW